MMVLYDDRTRAEIDLDALAANLQVLRTQVKNSTKIMAMVKADAYGHGAVPIAHELELLGADYLGVANIYEASSLREAGIHLPILVLGYTPAELTQELLRLHVTQTVQSYSHAQRLSQAAVAAGGTVKIHIKLDTGMSRCGIVCSVSEEKAAQEVREICCLPGLEPEGIFTHFAASEFEDETYTQMQYARFLSVLEKVRKLNVNIPLKHCANSAAVLKYPYMQMDMVRTGLALYGLSPLPQNFDFGLTPVLSLRTRIEQLKTLPAGTGVSYGVTFVTSRETRLAVLPIGYGDGLRRAYTNASFIVRGQRAPQIGRLCMDLCMLDVTDIPNVQEHDEVVLFGAPPYPNADAFAPEDGVNAYELLTGISKRVLRIYKRGGEVVSRMCYV